MRTHTYRTSRLLFIRTTSTRRLPMCQDVVIKISELNMMLKLKTFVSFFLPLSLHDMEKLIPDAISYSSKANYYLDLTVTCRTLAIQSIESPSHHISTKLNIDRAFVKCNPKKKRICIMLTLVPKYNNFDAR
ncbi:8375_t:CDS:2 [Gigaspora margarita]|uniref:8375_t:CDS:1 n=1 Tax=Gigaspora margarita TaxID=4874 RepID=A0ABN7UUG6_GIGMA|nr:8375_t:CDS:2 [Gigaspora margarita]